jgi:hypothetical protein
MEIFSNDFYDVQESSKYVYILIKKETDISTFESNGGIFDETKWLFDKSNKKGIKFLNFLLEINIEDKYKLFKPPISPKSMLLKMALSKDNESESPKKFPYKIHQTVFECENSGINYTILIADYNEKCICMYINANTSSSPGQLNKTFFTNYGDLIKKNGGLFNFKLKSIEGEHQYDTCPGWCFSKNKDNLNKCLEKFIGDFDLSNLFTKSTSSSIKFTKKETINKYVSLSGDLKTLMTLPLIQIETNNTINCSYGPIELINKLIQEKNLNVKFEIKNQFNHLIYY